MRVASIVYCGRFGWPWYYEIRSSGSAIICDGPFLTRAKAIKKLDATLSAGKYEEVYRSVWRTFEHLRDDNG